LFVSIDSGPANRPSKGMSIDKRVRSGTHTYTSPTPNPSDSEHTKITYMPKRGQGKPGEMSKSTSIGANDSSQQAGLGVHDHSEMDKGGPAFGVFSAS